MAITKLQISVDPSLGSAYVAAIKPLAKAYIAAHVAQQSATDETLAEAKQATEQARKAFSHAAEKLSAGKGCQISVSCVAAGSEFGFGFVVREGLVRQ